MVSPFEAVVKKFMELGFYNFLFPFIITSAIFYALLKKSKILGESTAISAAISLSAAFFIFGFPLIVGFNLEWSMSVFFTQVTVLILVFVIGILFASMFYPDIMKMMAEQFTRRTTLWTMIGLVFALFLTSGLLGTFWVGMTTGGGGEGGLSAPSKDITIVVAGIVLFIILIIIASAIVKGGT